MEFDEIIARRKSVRKFKNAKPDIGDVMKAIDSTLKGPFATNHNHLRFLLVENPETIEDIGELCEQEWIAGAKMLIVVCTDDTHLENTFDERGRVYSRQQAGAAINTLCLKLTESGLGSCWVGSYSDGEIRDALKIPEHIQVEAIVPVGYSDDATPRKPKKELENVLHWETWGNRRKPSKVEKKIEEVGGRIFENAHRAKS